MIYLDTSVVLAHLLGEARAPDVWLWRERLISSRLLEYEVWNRLHARALGAAHSVAAREVVARLRVLELTPTVLARAMAPFPIPVSTLDGLHLATVEYLQRDRQVVSLATYDRRMQTAAEAMGIPLVAL